MSLVLKKLNMHGFKSFAKKTSFEFPQPVTAIVGPNGSGKSNVVEAIRFVLGEQSAKSLRSKTGTDLIFKGSAKIPHSNRASVSITFDNSKRMFALPSLAESGGPNLDFDEVVVSREVAADGGQVYRINDSEVRMKDIHELIASVNIGTSGHHIISQGEADRLLGAKAVERREMLEESLGLRLYHYRIRETQKRLEKTRTHLSEVQSLRRELAPHIKFLKKQVEKIESAKAIREDLISVYTQYLSHEGNDIKIKASKIQNRLEQYQQEKSRIDQLLQTSSSEDQYRQELSTQEAVVANLKLQFQGYQRARDAALQSISRIDGMLEILSAPKKQQGTNKIVIDKEEIDKLLGQIEKDHTLERGLDIVQVVHNIISLLKNFLYGNNVENTSTGDDSTERRDELITEKNTLELVVAENAQYVENLQLQIDAAQSVILDINNKYRFGIESRQGLLQNQYENQRNIDTTTYEIAEIDRRKNSLQLAYTEAISLIGNEIINVKGLEITEDDIMSYESLRGLHTQIERLKIKLEDAGGAGGTETISEYEETLARDIHLESEIVDIEKTSIELSETLADLRTRLQVDFEAGIVQINTQFQEFFQTMFGGGSAKLSIVTIEKKKKKTENEEFIEIENEEGEPEIGVEIDVNLPRKKVTDLDMLSGGERSLTSIALLFALSQVNPPPFLVLDETDAALDEVNSRKYGDMIENLARQTQLVVVTHNRETMSRASILYGVTLGSDDCSTTLSISFQEAEKIAK